MIDLVEQQKVVLSGLLCEETKDSLRERMAIVMRDLNEDFFVEKSLAVYKCALGYYSLTYSKISRSEFEQVLESKNVDAATKLDYVSLFEDCENSEPVTVGQFHFACDLLKQQTLADSMVGLLGDTADILLKGKTVKRKEMVGYEAAKGYLLQGLGKLDKVEGVSLEDGDMNLEASAVLEEYAGAKHHRTTRIYTGLSEIDDLTDGLSPGELVFVAGFTGDGKSMACVNIASQVAYHQKKNVVYATGETQRNQLRRRILSLRSRDKRYGHPQGLPAMLLKRGQLTSEQEDVYRTILQDLGSGNYGRLVLFQFPRKTTVDYLASQLNRYQAEFNVDLFIVDELRLLAPSVRRGQRWEELDDAILGLKHLAVSHNHGQGVPIISPYQVRRDDWKRAIEENRPYNKTCLANSSEAERSADVICTLLRIPPEAGGNPSETRCSIIKNRDGEELPEFYLESDFRTCYLGSRDNEGFEYLE